MAASGKSSSLSSARGSTPILAARPLAAVVGPRLDDPEWGDLIRESLEKAGAPGGVLPLYKVKLEMLLQNVDVSFSSGLRRAMAAEKPGLRLEAPMTCRVYDPDSTAENETTRHDLLRYRLEPLPIRQDIDPEVAKLIRLGLQKSNGTSRRMVVRMGDLEPEPGTPELARPLFNPTAPLLYLKPGESIKISGIRIAVDSNDNDGRRVPGLARAASIPIDLDVVGPDATHKPHASHSARSGFVESSATAEPRNFMIRGVLPAVLKERAATAPLILASGAASSIASRLSFAAELFTVASKNAEAELGPDTQSPGTLRPRTLTRAGTSEVSARPVAGDARGDVVEPLGMTPQEAEAALEADEDAVPDGFEAAAEARSGVGVVVEGRLGGETYTIGELLVAYVLEQAPDVSFIAAEPDLNRNYLLITLRYSGNVPEACTLLATAAEAAAADYLRLEAELQDYLVDGGAALIEGA